MRTRILLIVFVAAKLSLNVYAVPWHFVPPAGSNVVNVKDYGAMGDGRTDDTDAVMRAIEGNIDKSRYRCNPMIYFPNGTYLVSGPIEGRVGTRSPDMALGKVWSAGWRSMMLLIGQTRDGAMIRLADNAPGYGDPEQPRWVVACGSEHDNRRNYHGGGNRAFRHGILNLTVDVGHGNPGAIGIDFIANNRGTVENVLVRAPHGSGHTGIAMTRNWPGPAMIHDVTIDGFDRGMALAHYQYGMTFEQITLRNQRSVGIANRQNVLAMRKIDFAGTVPFYQSVSGHNMLCLLDSTLKGSGAGNEAAISTNGVLNLRRVTVSGFDAVVSDQTSGDVLLTATEDETIVETFDKGIRVSGSGKPKALDLPIHEAPVVRSDAGTSWIIASTDVDELQQQIDNGAEYLYVRPLEPIKLPKPLIVRNKLKLMFGGSGMLQVDGDNTVAVQIENQRGQQTVFEHIYIEGSVQHLGDGTWALRHGDIHNGHLHGAGPGVSHIVDVIGKGYQIDAGHTFFARQLNAEFGPDPLFTNRGTSWILGFKMETSSSGSKHAPNSTPSILNQGGQLELFGGLLYTLGANKSAAPRVPAFTNERGQIAVSFRKNGVPSTYYRQILRVDDFDSGTDVITSEDVRGPGAALLSDQR